MPVIEQKVDPVLLGLDRIVDGARARDLQVADGKLESPRRAAVWTYRPSDLDRRFQCKLRKPFPRLRGQTTFHQHALQHSAAIAHDDKGDFTR